MVKEENCLGSRPWEYEFEQQQHQHTGILTVLEFVNVTLRCWVEIQEEFPGLQQPGECLLLSLED
jgi:hypothetical protein